MWCWQHSASVDSEMAGECLCACTDPNSILLALQFGEERVPA